MQIRFIKKAISVIFFISASCQFVFAQNNSDLFIGGEVHLDQGAIVHVLGDVKLESANGLLKNYGTLTIEGNLQKDNLSRYNTNSSGWIKFQNVQVNQSENQIIDGNFTGINAIHNMELGKASSTGLIIQNGDVQIIKELILSSGYIKTNPTVGGIPQFNNLTIINAAANAITGNLFGTFITGKFSRAFTNNTTIILPTGTDSPAIFGPQTMELTLKNGPGGVLEVEFTEPGLTAIGTQALCDVGTPPDALGTPDGNLDTMLIDCVNGRWNLTTSGNNPNFDLTLYPSQSLLDQCDFTFHFLSADGALLDDCPFPDFSYVGLADFAVFDIPGVVYLNNYNLPIELGSISAIGLNDFIDIKWFTITELNSLGFELERSLDGENFEFLVWKEGQGNTTDQTNYFYRDLQVQKGQIYYYRLKMVDLDGSFDYSEVVSASLENIGSFSEATIYPNPVSLGNPRINFTALQDGNLKISIFDNIGRIALNLDMLEVTEGFNSFNLPGSLSPGTYHIVFKDPLYVRRSTLVVMD